MDLAPVPRRPPRGPGARAAGRPASGARGAPALRTLGRVTAGALMALSPEGGQGRSRRNALDALVTSPRAAGGAVVPRPTRWAPGVRAVP